MSKLSRIGDGGAGTTTEARTYRFIDEPVSGRFCYRLKQADFDGAFAQTKKMALAK